MRRGGWREGGGGSNQRVVLQATYREIKVWDLSSFQEEARMSGVRGGSIASRVLRMRVLVLLVCVRILGMLRLLRLLTVVLVPAVRVLSIGILPVRARVMIVSTTATMSRLSTGARFPRQLRTRALLALKSSSSCTSTSRGRTVPVIVVPIGIMLTVGVSRACGEVVRLDSRILTREHVGVARDVSTEVRAFP